MFRERAPHFPHLPNISEHKKRTMLAAIGTVSGLFGLYYIITERPAFFSEQPNAPQKTELAVGSAEEMTQKLQEIKDNIQEVKDTRKSWSVVDPNLSSFFSELSNKADSDFAELNNTIKSKGANSLEAKLLTDKLFIDWYTTPKANTPTEAPLINISRNAENGDLIASEVEEIVKDFPTLGYYVEQINIDHGATSDAPDVTDPENTKAVITFHDASYKKDRVEWPRSTKEDRLKYYFNAIAKAISPYGNNAKLISERVPKTEFIAFYTQDVKALDSMFQTYQRERLMNPELGDITMQETNIFAWSAMQNLTIDYSILTNPADVKVAKQRSDNHDKWISLVRGKDFKASDYGRGKSLHSN